MLTGQLQHWEPRQLARSISAINTRYSGITKVSYSPWSAQARAGNTERAVIEELPGQVLRSSAPAQQQPTLVSGSMEPLSMLLQSKRSLAPAPLTILSATG